MSPSCPATYHRHQLTCSKCHVTDQTVASTQTRDGRRWPPTCAACSAKAARVRAVERVEGLA